METCGHLLALAHALRELAELRQRHGALQLRHPAVERDEVVIGLLVAVAPGLVDEEPHPARQRVIVGDDHAALAGRDVLALLEAEAADRAERAEGLAGVAGTVGLGAILDHRDPVLIGKPEDRPHVGRVSEEMSDDDRLRLRA